MSLPFVDALSPATIWLPAALWMIARASVLLALAVIAQALIRRRSSAATRHLVWTLAIVSLLLLPAVALLLPTWEVPVPIAQASSLPPSPSSAASTGEPAAAATDAGPRRARSAAALASAQDSSTRDASLTSPASTISRSPTSAIASTSPMSPARGTSPIASLSTILLGLYAAGVLGLLLRLAAQRWTMARLARAAVDVRDPEWTDLLQACARSMGVSRPVRLLRSREQAMPMAFGTRHPAILIPAMADLWTEDRRRAVLLHELAHVARRDCLTQMWAAVACAIYWMHPGVWWVARQLRVERELACDDRVLTVGTQAREYAGHLLELAYSLGGGRAPALAVSMARPQQLEGRMLAVLDAARNRATPGLRDRLAGAAITAALLLPLAGTEARVVPAGPDALAADAGTNDPQAAETGADLPASIASTVSTSSIGQSSSSSAVTAGSEQDRLTPDSPGTWEIRPGQTTETVRLQLRERNSSSGFSIGVDRLEGLTADQRSGAGGPVTFTVRRDAGTFTFEGVFRSGVGGGTYTFAPSATFPAELVKRGFARPTPADQLALARHDVGFAFLDELTTQSYPKPTLPLLVRAGQHGVGLDYLRGMGAAGYRVGALETLIELRDHGVTPDYIRDLAANGYKGLSAQELRRARDHGVSADYVKEMRALGYDSLSMDALINARDHGVSSDYAREMGDLGYRKLPLEELIRVRDHGVSADYVRGLAALGHTKLPLDELVRLRDHGVSPDFVREMRDLGYALPLDQLQRARDHGVSADYVRGLAEAGHGKLPLERVINARDHGVSADFAREMKTLGYTGLTLDDLVGLRDQGVTAAKITRANERAGTKLPLDMIKSMARGGMKE